MNRKELARRTALLMREKEMRKPVSIPKQIFHISDNDGNSRDFSIKKRDKTVLFTVDDVEMMIDALIYVIEDALKRGEAVSVRGFGTLCLHYRKSRKLKHVGTGEDTFAEARYVPKFLSGNNLRTAARLYEIALGNMDEPLPVFDDANGGE